MLCTRPLNKFVWRVQTLGRNVVHVPALFKAPGFWVLQVQEHVRFNCLKVLVISSDKDRSNKMPSPSSLAWDYDLVRHLQAHLNDSVGWAE